MANSWCITFHKQTKKQREKKNSISFHQTDQPCIRSIYIKVYAIPWKEASLRVLEAMSLAATLPQLPLPTTVTLDICEAALLPSLILERRLIVGAVSSMAAGGAMKKEEEETKRVKVGEK